MSRRSSRGGATTGRISGRRPSGPPLAGRRILTGDSIYDLIAVSPFLDVGGVEDTGAVLFWKGPLETAGEPTILFVPGASPGDLLGSF